MPKVTFTLNDEEVIALDQEAADAGKARDPYVGDVVRGRHNKEITVKANDERLIARLEGKIEVLTEQNRELTDKLAKAQEAAGLAGVETTKSLTAKQLEERDKKLLEQWETTQKLKEYEKLQRDHADLQKRHQELSTERDSQSTWNKVVEVGGSIAGTIAQTRPDLVNRLAGLVGLGDAPGVDGVGALPEADQQALEAGRVFQALNPAIHSDFGRLLGALVERPDLMNHIMRMKPVVDTMRRQAAQPN